MPSLLDASAVLERDFLEMRHRVLDLAAALDRIDRADRADAVRGSPRVRILSSALRVLTDGEPDRAERVQLIFSEHYEQTWRSA